jgi:molecular chaperone HtpG
LATIGGFSRASAAETVDEGAGDLVSRLGLGLAACFTVADEVRVLTRSLDASSPSLEWVGRGDGSYTLRRLGYDMQPGTQVYLRPRPESRPLFQAPLVRQAATDYGEFLPYPLAFSHGQERTTLNNSPLWSADRSDPEAWRRGQLRTARRLLGADFLDALPIRSSAGGVTGVALIKAERQGLLHKPEHRVYRDGVLLTEEAANLLPHWATFVTCIANVRDLRPTLLFDGLEDDERLAAARRALGRSLHLQLAEMAEAEPERWRRIVEVHLPTMKTLASEDEEFFRLFIELLPLDSSAGRASLSELARQHLSIYYVSGRQRLGQLAELAGALGLGVVFAADEQEAALLERASRRAGAAPLRALEVGELAKWLGDLESGQQRAAAPFLDLADEVLRPLACAAELKPFGTPRVLALLLPPHARLDDSPGISARDPASVAYNQLWLNFDHPIVRQLVSWTDPVGVAKAVKLIYAHAKLSCTGEVDRVGAKLLFEGLRESLGG